jgi:hypothetical protein
LTHRAAAHDRHVDCELLLRVSLVRVHSIVMDITEVSL